MSELVERTWSWCLRHGDAAAALVLTAAGAASLAAGGLMSSPAELACSVCLLGVTVFITWRRRQPIAVSVAAGALLTVPTLSGYSSAFYGNSVALYSDVLSATIFFALFMYAYALGSYRPWRRSLIGLVTMSAGLLVAAGVGVNSFVVVAIVGPWLCGLVVASRRDMAKQLEDRAREIEEERQLFADQSVRYERARIARELHDIVAHSVSLMVVQANAGEHLARRDPQAAAEAFASIGEAARQSEAEIARLVELLDTSTPATPSTGLRIVDDLVGRARASGLRLTCQFSGDSDNLSEPAAESLYRMAQEAVTNAMKHAPGASIDIAVVGHTGSVELRVVNQPALSPRSGLEDAGGGHGVAGMRERVAEMGGTFSAGPTPERGWVVVACIPRYPRREVATISPRAPRWK
jgi:signal transduction histidine kinase